MWGLPGMKTASLDKPFLRTNEQGQRALLWGGSALCSRTRVAAAALCPSPAAVGSGVAC